ncbi:hypothetical protein [Streptomyces sp. NPDC057199]|uniref:hypothetical protein n=1 Tax=Streptomyces sp. NPDC057199 TaxID=3346047 RepID=UPI0036409D42
MADRLQPVPEQVTAPLDAVSVPGPKAVQVAAFGDSAMWGQGLERDKRYTALLVNGLIPALYGRPAQLVWDKSRSGAKIRARGDDREVFLDRYPAVFQNLLERKIFFEGSNDTPASRLYGEIPAPFPLIRQQVDLLANDVGSRIDIALLNGGINDLDIEDIIDPRVANGEFIERWDGQIRAVCYDDVTELLGRLRRKCPNAVILHFGMFAPLTEESNVQKIRDLLKHEYDNDFGWWFNEHVHEVIDVDALISEAITRSQWLRGRFQYWTRQAVRDANRTAAVRGPGVLFVPSGFTNGQSVFAPAPFLFEDYTHPTGDPAQARRVRECPRAAVLDRLVEMRNVVDFVAVGAHTDAQRRASKEAGTLEAAIDGPLRVKWLLARWRDNEVINRTDAFELSRRLASEIGRIQTSLIASVSHPNSLGAQSYADNATRRLREHREVTQHIVELERPGSPPPLGQSPGLESTLRRYRLRSSGSLRADVGHLDVDSFAVRVVSAQRSDVNLRPDIWLVVSTRSSSGKAATRNHRLNFRYTIHRLPDRMGGDRLTKLYAHFEPGKTNLFTVDPQRRLRLEEITGCALVVGPDPIPRLGRDGTVWRPSIVELEVNGVRVLRKQFPPEARFGPGAHVDLDYPDPQPQFVPPKVAPVVLAHATPFIPQRRTAPEKPPMPPQVG